MKLRNELRIFDLMLKMPRMALIIENTIDLSQVQNVVTAYIIQSREIVNNSLGQISLFPLNESSISHVPIDEVDDVQKVYERCIGHKDADKVLSMIKNGTYTDFLFIDEKGEITIDIAVKIVSFCQKSPLFLKKKIVIINNFQNINTNASNALLKTIEELHDTYMIVITSNINKISQTIKSRCMYFLSEYSLETYENSFILDLMRSSSSFSLKLDAIKFWNDYENSDMSAIEVGVLKVILKCYRDGVSDDVGANLAHVAYNVMRMCINYRDYRLEKRSVIVSILNEIEGVLCD
ncbi:hypothetical protein [Candidatus Gromoviella agglomerans]|uniref:hypothetical protein n=1 Tax=Candidatus Gromoviella agglomerans TaxID=2806609 RepID=UPI001E2F9261|nr:hypothetical protein [Candidatus Gromoviella agglomerans]UFX98130.1 DNA polymerase III subunit delta' domain protein [Candidatus Gromoviella agglomerans]